MCPVKYGKVLFSFTPPNMRSHPTIIMGVAVCSHLDSPDGLLQWVKELEAEAILL